jgi:hypothetical protein
LHIHVLGGVKLKDALNWFFQDLLTNGEGDII